MNPAARRALSACLAVSLALSSTPLAFAQEPQPAPAPSGTGDVVKLKNGSIFRGTIVELVAGDHVDLLVPSGETRRFPMKDVEYAGTFNASPPAPPAPAPAAAAPAGVPVRVEANDSDVQLLDKTGEEEFEATGYVGGRAAFLHGVTYRPICTAPCETQVAPGQHELALRQGSGRAVPVDGVTSIAAPSVLRAQYESKAGLRTAGWITVLAGPIVGVVLTTLAVLQTKQDCSLKSVTGSCSNAPDANVPLLVGGIGVTLAAVVAGMALLFQRDIATVDVVPANGAGVRF